LPFPVGKEFLCLVDEFTCLGNSYHGKTSYGKR
jgi:hypothetical protein